MPTAGMSAPADGRASDRAVQPKLSPACALPRFSGVFVSSKAPLHCCLLLARRRGGFEEVPSSPKKPMGPLEVDPFRQDRERVPPIAVSQFTVGIELATGAEGCPTPVDNECLPPPSATPKHA